MGMQIHSSQPMGIAFPAIFPNSSPSFVRIQDTLWLSRSRKKSVSCKLRPPQNETSGRKALIPPPPPPLKDVAIDAEQESAGNAAASESGGGGGGFGKKLGKKVLSVLSHLPLAIGEMATAAALMALGNLIPSSDGCLFFSCFPIFGVPFDLLCAGSSGAIN